MRTEREIAGTTHNQTNSVLVTAELNGRAFFCSETTKDVMEGFGQMTREQRDCLRLAFDRLTARELDILLELARGSTDREVAAKFVLFEDTVKTHLRSILKKLGARNRTQAVEYGRLKGLIE